MVASSCPGELMLHDIPINEECVSDAALSLQSSCRLHTVTSPPWRVYRLASSICMASSPSRCVRPRYSGLLERHADLVLGAAAEALHGRGRSHGNGGGAVKQVLRRLLQVCPAVTHRSHCCEVRSRQLPALILGTG